MRISPAFFLLPLLCLLGHFCLLPSPAQTLKSDFQSPTDSPRLVHVYVALCDNANQGIVKVPASLGNGQNPRTNLYWGAAYGVKTYFKRSAHWQWLKTEKNPRNPILERLWFRHASEDVWLVADAYDGASIKACTSDFLKAAAGKASFPQADSLFGRARKADLLAYVGHNGLMDFQLDSFPKRADSVRPDAILLGCLTRSYFGEAMERAGARPLLWTTGLMAPEAYTLEAALHAWAQKQSPDQIRQAAAAAYHTYQKCGIKGASRLLVGEE
jgi:hypothetical protein